MELSSQSHIMIQYENSYKQILKIATPISFSLMIPQISFVANTIFVSQLGNLAIVILGLVSIYYLLLTWMSYGLNNGLLMLLSRKSGAQDDEGYTTYLYHGVLLGLFMIVILFIGSWFLLPAYYRYSYKDIDVIQGGIDFFKFRIWGLPFMLFSQMANIVLISVGKSRWLIPSSILSNGTLILLDYVLIFGNFGFEAMGVQGAALASVISEIVNCSVVIGILFYNNIFKKLSYAITLKWNVFKDIITVSSPLILQYIFSIGGWLIFFNFMEHLGREQVAASHIMRNMLGVIGIGAWAFASTSNTLVSNLIGQKKNHEVISALKKLSIVALIFALIITVITYIGKDYFISFFTQDNLVISLINQGIIVLWVVSFILCTGTIAFNGLMGLGNTRKNMIIEVTAVIVYTIYIFILVKWLALDFFWAWTSEWVYWVILLTWSWYAIINNKLIKNPSLLKK